MISFVLPLDHVGKRMACNLMAKELDRSTFELALFSFIILHKLFVDNI